MKGTEGNYLDNSNFSVYRMYAYDYVNNRTIWFIDNSNPRTFIFPAPIDVLVSHNLAVQGGVNAGAIYYSQVCRSATSPAVCGGAPSGASLILPNLSRVTVNTTAVTANSTILLTQDASLGQSLSASCDIAPQALAVVARTPGVSFTVAVARPSTVASVCFSYAIHN